MLQKRTSIITINFIQKVFYSIHISAKFCKTTMRVFPSDSFSARQLTTSLLPFPLYSLYLMLRTEALYIYREWSTGRSFVHFECRDTTAARRLLLRPAYLSANATYKHQFNVWNLSKWISPGSCFPGPPFFFPRWMRSWCEISLYYCAVTWGVSGRFPLLLFQDNPFERQDTSMWREIRLYQSVLLYFLLCSQTFVTFDYCCYMWKEVVNAYKTFNKIFHLLSINLLYFILSMERFYLFFWQQYYSSFRVLILLFLIQIFIW